MDTVFVGRADELKAIHGVLDLARSGLSGAMVIRGQAGAGKTALLDAALAEAGPLRVVRVACVQAETNLSYAALHGALLPFLAGLDSLPQPQRAALCAAFGLEDGPAPNRMLVGLGALTLLAEVAAQQRLVLVVDDAQWLDKESADVLAFVARHLYADGIAILIAVRDPPPPPVNLAGLPEVHLGGLPTADALELLSSAVAGVVGAHVSRRLAAETRGNPLALLELVEALTPSQLAGRARLPDPLPVGMRLQQALLRPLHALPPATQMLLVIAAAEFSGDAARVWRAAELLGLGPDAAAPAEAAELLAIGAVVEFRCPLLRAAVYHGAAAAELRRVHAALAAANECDPDRRAWHRAAAAFGPDEEVATELERAAERVCARDGHAAAKLLARASELTADESRRPKRALAAACAALTAGDVSAAEALSAEAAARLEDPIQRADSLRLKGTILFAQGVGGEPFTLLMQAAVALRPLDAQRARDALFEALEVAAWTGPAAMLEVARAACDTPRVAGTDATARDLLLEAFASRILDGFVPAAPLFRRAVAAARAEASDVRVLHLASIASGELWDLDGFLALTRRWVESSGTSGAPGLLTRGLALRAAVELLSGSYADVGENRGPACLATAVEARSAAEDRVRQGLGHSQGTRGVIVAELDPCHRELGLRAYESACLKAALIYEADFIGPVTAWNIADMVEAAHRAGDRHRAVSALERLADRAPASGTSTALGLLARSKALLQDGDAAEDLYREAISHLERSPSLSDLARSHLVYGEWLRRYRRRRDARHSLRIASDMFDAIGATFFADRARTELLATGERARLRIDGSRDDLTPQELQIAQLVASGATNREIGAQLFISPSTVAYHLRHVFRKLEVTARAQVRDALVDRIADRLVQQAAVPSSGRR